MVPFLTNNFNVGGGDDGLEEAAGGEGDIGGRWLDREDPQKERAVLRRAEYLLAVARTGRHDANRRCETQICAGSDPNLLYASWIGDLIARIRLGRGD